MSLLVWLPLDGNLNNQGLLQLPDTSNNTFTYEAGKIGQGGNGTVAWHLSEEILGNTWSVATWIKPTSLSSTNNIIFCKNTSTSTDCQIYFSIISTTQLNIGVNGPSSSISKTGLTFSLNIWYHVAATYDGSTVILYLNGNEVNRGTVTTAMPSGRLNMRINGRSNNAANTAATGGFNGIYNDFRLYNHALSAQEIKELSLGLIVHYKLDDTYMETSTMLSSTIDNGTAYNGSSGKYGYNETSNLAKTKGIFQGKECIKISTITAGSNAQPYVYFSNLFTSDGTNAPAYKALSFDYYTTCPTTTWLNIYKLGSGTGTATWKTTSLTAGIRSGTYTNSSNSILVQPNEWNHIEVIFNGTTSANAEWGYCINGPAHVANANYYFLYANIQLEQNDHVTGYGANMHNEIAQDSSGYEHNGIITGNISTIINSGRYSNCIYISSGNTDYITTPTLQLPGDAITINFWFKSSNKSPGSGYHMPFEGTASSNQSYEMSIHSSGYLRGGLVVSGTRKVDNCTSTNLTDGNWHMCSMTYDGSIIKRYVDGIMEKSTSATGALATSTAFVIGHYGSNTSYYCKEASISDIRLYTTALLDDDIKKLYNTSMSIDNFGSIYTYEFDENGSNKLTKTGKLLDYCVEPYMKLADGSCWKMIMFHWVNKGTNLFTSTTAPYNNGDGLFSRLQYIDNYIYNDKYEFYVIQDDVHHRWSQTSAPTASSITGFTTISGNPVQGIAKGSTSNTYLGYNAWWGACGCYNSYTLSGKTGIPGFGPHTADGICQQYLVLYARIDPTKYNAALANLSCSGMNLIEW